MQRLARAALAAFAFAGAGASQQARAQQRVIESPAPAPVGGSGAARLGPSITVGMGLARHEPYCIGCLRSTGLAALVNLSRFLDQTIAIGMESTLWLNNSGPASTALGSAMGAVTVWAVEDVPLSISGGLGFIVYYQGNATTAITTTSAGLGCSGRIGYEARVAPGLALVPYLGYVNSLGRLRANRGEQVVSNLQIGMGLRFR